MNEQQREKLEVLDGSRGRGPRPRAAVRIVDLQALLELPPKLQAKKAAGTTPTKAEYDALVADVAAIHRRLTVLANALRDRLLA